MSLGPIPDHLLSYGRNNFLAQLKSIRSLDYYELDLFQWFRRETEDTLVRMETEERNAIQEQIESRVEDINDSGILAVNYYRRRMRSSHLIFLASLLEGAMKRECDKVLQALNDQVLFKPSELKGDPWSVRKTFLERYGAFQIPEGMWKPISNLLDVRNALVHHSGDAMLLTDEQKSKLSKISGISIDTGEVDIDVGFIDESASSVRVVMDFVHQMTNALIDQQK